MFGKAGVAPVAETSGQFAGHAQAQVELAQEQGPAIRREAAAGKIGHDLAGPQRGEQAGLPGGLWGERTLGGTG
jgi:hypothetical protein